MKVGKTLGGSQLLNIANLPAVHYPFVLGIPRQLPCAPFTVEHQDAISDSLFLLLKLFVTQDCSMMAFSSFCKQMLQEAMQDSGHLISTVAAIGGCLATVMVTNPREELKTQNSPHASGVSLCGHRTQSGPETPANLSVALTKATAVAGPGCGRCLVPHRSSQFWSVFALWSGSLRKIGNHWVLRLQVSQQRTQWEILTLWHGPLE